MTNDDLTFLRCGLRTAERHRQRRVGQQRRTDDFRGQCQLLLRRELHASRSGQKDVRRPGQLATGRAQMFMYVISQRSRLANTFLTFPNDSNLFLFLMTDGRCPELPLFERGTVTVSGLNANDTATYSCQVGHKLVGEKILTCRLGGLWSGSPPLCQFVDCGPAPEVKHGSVWLVNGTTTFSSQATYTCDTDYRLQGRTTRLCQEDGNWSSSSPQCKCNYIF